MEASLEFMPYEKRVEKFGEDETLREARKEADKYAYKYGVVGFYIEFVRVYMHLHGLGLWPSLEKWDEAFLDKLKKIGEEPIK